MVNGTILYVVCIVMQTFHQVYYQGAPLVIDGTKLQANDIVARIESFKWVDAIDLDVLCQAYTRHKLLEWIQQRFYPALSFTYKARSPCVIAVYNHKGGVGKTTNVIHLTDALVRLGKRVLLVDADPQCNLTSFIAGDYDHSLWTALNLFYQGRATSSDPQPQPVQSVFHSDDQVFLIPGHPLVGTFDCFGPYLNERVVTGEGVRKLGSFRHLFTKAAEMVQADYVLVDLGPSTSHMNRMICMYANYILPVSFADFFSVTSVHGLVNHVLTQWFEWRSMYMLSQTQTFAFSKISDDLTDFVMPDRAPQVLPVIVTAYKGDIEHDITRLRQIMNEAPNPVKQQMVAWYSSYVFPLAGDLGPVNLLVHRHHRPLTSIGAEFFAGPAEMLIAEQAARRYMTLALAIGLHQQSLGTRQLQHQANPVDIN